MKQFTSMEDKLGLNKFTAFEKTHLSIKPGSDPLVVEHKLFICPAKVYELSDKGVPIVSFENCLECGTCRVAAPDEVEWAYPQGGYGVTYKFG